MLTIDARWSGNSGIGTYIQNVIPGIIKRFPDLDIVLIGDSEVLRGFGWLSRPNIRSIQVDARMYSVSEQWQLFRHIPRETSLLFYPHYNVPVLYRGKMLVVVHDLCHLALNQLGGSFLKTAYSKFLFNSVRRNADTVITDSLFTRDEFIRFTQRRDTQPILPVHLGVSAEWFDAASLRGPEVAATLENGAPYALYVGNIKPHKNLSGLVNAWRILANSVPHKLVIVGKREGLITADEKVQKAAAELGDRIAFTGYLDRDSLKRRVANAELLILPTFYEGFGLPPLEAMAARCPVAVSDIPVLREVCGDAAIYFNPHDPEDIATKVRSLLLDDLLLEKMRGRGLLRARQFSWDTCVNETCDIVQKMLG